MLTALPKPGKLRDCAHCNNEFQARQKHQKYCCAVCQQDAQYLRRKEKLKCLT